MEAQARFNTQFDINQAFEEFKLKKNDDFSKSAKQNTARIIHRADDLDDRMNELSERLAQTQRVMMQQNSAVTQQKRSRNIIYTK